MEGETNDFWYAGFADFFQLTVGIRKITLQCRTSTHTQSRYRPGGFWISAEKNQ